MLAANGALAQDVSAIRANDARERSAVRAPDAMRIYGPAQAPHGFVRFCEAVPKECSSEQHQEGRFNASPARLSELDEVNRAVNRAIAPATDLDIYGVNEYWTLPRTKGDCEDYALLKRQTLIAKGWPVSSLLLTVVRDEKGEGHAVLTARTMQGDYVLDNKIEDVRIWHNMPYQFVMRQSYLNPRVWVALDTRQGSPATALSGLENGE
jgi:predicted transglutaminase-like cysteine proteinase